MSQDGPQRVELSPSAKVYTPPRPGIPAIVHGVAYPVPEDWESPTIDTAAAAASHSAGRSRVGRGVPRECTLSAHQVALRGLGCHWVWL